MSLLAQRRKSLQTRGIFGAILGQRTAGKSTIAGTLPGRTCMLTAKTFETGAASAQALAAERGNQLDVFEFASAKELVAMAKEAVAEGYDNLFIDGASGLTEIMYRTPEIAKKLNSNQWEAYALLADHVEDALLAIKELAEVDNGVNIFVTASVEAKYDQAGNVIEYAIESKGRSVIKNLRKLFGVVVHLRPAFDGDGNRLDAPELVTKTDGPYMARIDSLLAHHNSGIMEADLTSLISLIKGA
jgi:hypothetical protein